MEEVAQGRRRWTFGTFPAEWGTPPGTQFSEERAAWVAARVGEHQALSVTRRRAQLAAQGTGDGGHYARRMRALLIRRRYGPMDHSG